MLVDDVDVGAAAASITGLGAGSIILGVEVGAAAVVVVVSRFVDDNGFGRISRGFFPFVVVVVFVGVSAAELAVDDDDVKSR